MALLLQPALRIRIQSKHTIFIQRKHSIFLNNEGGGGSAINSKHLKLLILLAFCLSSATIGGPLLLHGSNIHIGHHNVHIHYDDEVEQCLDEENHSDKNIALYFDYLAISPSHYSKAYLTDNLCLHAYCPPLYSSNFSSISSRSIHYSSINRFCPTYLYQLKSSYLI